MNAEGCRRWLVPLDEVRRRGAVYVLRVLLAAFDKTVTRDKRIRKRPALQRRGWFRAEGLLGAERPDIREKCLDDVSPDDPRRDLACIPLPLPQTAAVSLVRGLMQQGMQPAAAMAFLIGGPVTSIPALALLSTGSTLRDRGLPRGESSDGAGVRVPFSRAWAGSQFCASGPV